jgi:hypothetical protein
MPKMAQLRAARRRPDRDEQSRDLDPDCHWNSCVPHLLATTPRAVNPHNSQVSGGVKNPMTLGKPHPTRQSFGNTRRIRSTGSHLGSTLKPGGAVLTLGVSRRSGSVAYIRVDASPNEVLTQP